MRRLAIAVNDLPGERGEVTVWSDGAFFFLNCQRSQLSELESETKKRVVVREDPKLALDDVNLELYDARDGLVYLPELGMSPVGHVEDPRRRQGQHAQPGRRDEHRRGARGQQPHQQPRRSGQRAGARDQGARHDERDSQREREDERYDLDPVDEPAARRGRADREEQEHPEESGRGDAESIETSADDNRVEEADHDEEQAATQVVDVDEANEPMGEGPQAIDSRGDDDSADGRHRRRRRGRRGRGGRGRNRSDAVQKPQQQVAEPTDEEPAPIADQSEQRDEEAESAEDTRGNVAEPAESSTDGGSTGRK